MMSKLQTGDSLPSFSMNSGVLAAFFYFVEQSKENHFLKKHRQMSKFISVFSYRLMGRRLIFFISRSRPKAEA